MTSARRWIVVRATAAGVGLILMITGSVVLAEWKVAAASALAALWCFLYYDLKLRSEP
jgi:hypothetical protein